MFRLTNALNVTEETEQIVEDAVMRALDSLFSNIDDKNDKEKTSEHVIVSQQANEESKIAQFTGEVLEEATRILVKEFGMVNCLTSYTTWNSPISGHNPSCQ